MTMTYLQLGTEIGALVDVKNAAYGSSFEKCGDFLRLLFPEGIPPHRLEDALLLVRIFDKQMRIATDQDAFGESPYADIAGYGLLGAKQHKEKQERCRGSVSGENAQSPSKAQPDSAAQTTSGRTTTSESGPNAPWTLQPTSASPASSSAPASATTDSAPAPTAAESVDVSAVGRARVRNADGRCAAEACEQGRFLQDRSYFLGAAFEGRMLFFHHDTCKTWFEMELMRESERQA
jgi:hypothetical protein